MGIEILKTRLPRIISVGPNLIEYVPETLIELGVHESKSPIILVHDSITWDIAGKEIVDLLQDSDISSQHYCIKRPTIEEAKNVSSLALDAQASYILGVGGGSVIDVAKLSSKIARLPFVSIPTNASHDGIASMRASLLERDKKKSFEANPPIAVIADLAIIAKAPFRFLAAGSGDAIANKTAVLDWELAHRLKGERIGEYPRVLADMAAEHVIRDSNLVSRGDLIAAKIVTKALITSSIAMCLAGSSRPASGSEHLFSHALDRILKRPALHGEQTALGSILMMYLHGGDWQRIRGALETIGAPTTAQAAGIPDEKIIEALLIAHTIRPERYTILGSTGLTEQAAREAAEITGII